MSRTTRAGWSKERPTTAGWYWVKWLRFPQFGPEIREVVQPNGPDTDYLEVDDAPIDEYITGCGPIEWAGPLPMPREA